jgi:hypothetical protein
MAEVQTKSKPEKKIIVRLDRTRSHGSVHGERTPEDPMHSVAFMQGGLPFDTSGNLVGPPEKPEETFRGLNVDGEEVTYRPLWTEEMREKLKAKIKRLKRAADDAEIELANQEPLEAPVDPVEDVNLESWLRGEVQYPFYMLSRAVQQRFHVKCVTMRSLIETLVLDEKIVPEIDVEVRLIRLLDQKVDPRLASGAQPRREVA